MNTKMFLEEVVVTNQMHIEQGQHTVSIGVLAEGGTTPGLD